MGRGTASKPSKFRLSVQILSQPALVAFFIINLFVVQGQARPAFYHCDELLTVYEYNFNQSALTETTVGRQIHGQIENVMAKTPATLELMVNSRPEGWTYSEFLTHLVNERESLIGLLNGLIPQIDALHLQDMFQDALTRLLPRGDGNFERKVEALIRDHGGISVSVAHAQSQGTIEAKLWESAMSLWTQIRGTMAEVQTALEIRGLTGMSMHIRDMVHPEDRARFSERLRQIGAPNVENLEIDVVSWDPIRKRYMWVEVKHPHEILTTEKSMRKLDTYTDRFRQLRKAVRTLRNDPELRQYFPHWIDVMLVIKGEGISDGAQKVMHERGVEIYDRSLGEFNSQYGTRR